MKKAYRIMYLFICLLTACAAMAQGQSAKYREIIEKGNRTPLASLLSEKELTKFSKDELRIIRNTIFAQYGFTFGVEDLKKHFEQFDWYKATGSNVDQYLTDIDRENIRIIQALESNAAVQEEAKPDNLTYVAIQKLTSPTIITLQSIDEFRKLIQQYNITVILYDVDAFYFEHNTLIYSIASNGYQKITEYEHGFRLEFKNGESYYFALENKLSNQEEVDYFKTQNFITSADFFDARSMGLINNSVQNKISTVIGLIRKSDFQKFSRYINILLYTNDSGTMPLDNINTTDIEEIVRRSNGYIRPFGETMYYVSIPVKYRVNNGFRQSMRNSSRNNNGIGDDALFYYALKIAQYSNIAEYITNSRNVYHYSIKNNEVLTKELGYEKYEDFEDSMGRNITNSKDYYVVRQYVH